MRSGLATIQQSLTPEAASVLSHSITEAGRRNHSQVTPLHVAATLLASPSSFLRQACIRSHPNSSHPLQCRALELCFSVALDRLPMTQAAADQAEPPISNALMAALKRAQAHQRRGCPDQQHYPLLTVKVELEQLIISILDDPSVSRVMREASFSSPAVKATIEKSMNPSSSSSIQSSSPGLGFRPGHVPVSVPNRNMYLNPRLQLGQHQNAAQAHFGQQGSQFGQVKVNDVKSIVDIMSRNEKRNPVLVGDSELQPVLNQLLAKVENKELSETVLRNAEVIHVEKEMVLVSDRSEMSRKIKELGDLIERRMCDTDKMCGDGTGGVVLNLGDLKWLVEQQQGSGVAGWGVQPVVSEVGRLAVEEVGKLLGRFGGRLWLTGMATCKTFLKCQVYHNSMEKDWNLQAVPFAANSAAHIHGAFPRLGTTAIMHNSVQPATPLKNLATSTNASFGHMPQNLDPATKLSCCPQCKENYEKELADIMSMEFESPTETSSEAANQSLPAWLQSAKMTGQQLQGKERRQKTEELMKKWNETCLLLHPNFNHFLGPERVMKPLTRSMTSLLNPKLLNPKLVAQQPFPPKLQTQRNLMDTTLQLNPTFVPDQPRIGLENDAPSPPRSPVRTELVIGRRETPEKTDDDVPKDFMSCISSGPQNASMEMQANKLLSSLMDTDWLKKLMKTLTAKVWWQREAASAVATTIAQCKMGSSKQRGAGSKGNAWLLFTGPDRVGKSKMALALSELVCGLSPVVISFGSRQSDDKTNLRVRGTTALDRIGDVIKRNPFSVIMLEDIDEADLLTRGNIKRAMERGRIADSHGREIGLGNVTFILTSSWLPNDFKVSSKSRLMDEERFMATARGQWQLKLTTGQKTAKRRANWTAEEDEDKDKCTRARKDLSSALVFNLNEAADTDDLSSALVFNLNEAADTDDDRANGSGNSSDLTAEHDEDSGNLRSRYSFINPATQELLTHVDSSIVFDPVDFRSIRQRLSSSITITFSTIICNGESMRIQDDALEKILGGIWLGQQTLEDWLEDVLVPSLQKLKKQLQQCHDLNEPTIVRLEVDDSSSHTGQHNFRDWLPSSIRVAVD